MIKGIKDKAMLVSITIHAWVARKYDPGVSAEVSARHANTSDAGRFNKRLLPGKAASYDAVLKKARELRAFYYKNTLPWSADGSRILPSANYQAFADGVRRLRKDFDQATGAFLQEYPILKEDAKVLLNGLYREEDYPTPTEMAGKFGVRVDILPLPDADDFRVSLSEAEAEAIRINIRKRMQEEVAAANRDLWVRVRTAVGNIISRLQDPEGIFRDSLIGNLRELVELVPRLNMTGDEKLDEIVEQSKALLVSPQTLREDIVERARVTQRAREIAEVMDAYM